MPEAAAAAPAANTTQPAQPTTPAPDANAWTDDDSKGFEALLKKRGLKVKANGEEKAISSLDDLMKEFEFSSKGRGAAKMTAEAKREAEEAKAAKAEAARTGRTLGALIEDAIRMAMSRSQPVDGVPELPTFGRSGTLDGVDLSSSSAVLDLMEGGRSTDAMR